MEFVSRDLLKEPLTLEELTALGKRVDDVRDLVKPLNKSDVEGMSDKDVLRYLAKNPNSVRRPIIDTGKILTLGFTPAAREQLLGKK